MDIMKQKFGAIVDGHKRSHGYNNSDLAKLLKVSAAAVGAWCSGKNMPNLVIIKRMRVFGMDFSSLPKGFGEIVTLADVRDFCKKNKLTFSDIAERCGFASSRQVYKLTELGERVFPQKMLRLWQVIHNVEPKEEELSMTEVHELKDLPAEKEWTYEEIEQLMTPKDMQPQEHEVVAEESPAEEIAKVEVAEITPATEETKTNAVTINRLFQWASRYGIADVKIEDKNGNEFNGFELRVDDMDRVQIILRS